MLKNFIFIFLLFILESKVLISEEVDKALLEFNYKHFNSIFYFTASYPFSADSKDFISFYNTLFNRDLINFRYFPLLDIGTKFQFWNNYRIGVDIQYFNANVRDNYAEEFYTTDEKGYRELEQNISLLSLPTCISLEYFSLNQQFRTYLGTGVGLDFSILKWNERLNSSIDTDIRKGGTHYNQLNIYPCVKFFIGTELGFDKFSKKKFLSSFIIETSFFYSFRTTDMFSIIAEQFEKLPEGIRSSYAILPYYLGLNIGLSFNITKN